MNDTRENGRIDIPEIMRETLKRQYFKRDLQQFYAYQRSQFSLLRYLIS